MNKLGKYIFCLKTAVLIFLIASCNKPNAEINEENSIILNLDHSRINSRHINIDITIKGKAKNAKEGAVIIGSEDFVIIEGLERWNEAQYNKEVAITGKLYEITYEPIDEGDIAARPEGTFHYLKMNHHGTDKLYSPGDNNPLNDQGK